MDKPPHPGRIIKRHILPALQLSIVEAAQALGINRVTFSKIINEHSPITPDMAVRLSLWLPNVPAARWLELQARHDLARIDALQFKVQPVKRDLPELPQIDVRCDQCQ